MAWQDASVPKPANPLAKYIPAAVVVFIYLIFWVWYTPFGGPLTQEEIDNFLEGRGGDALDVAFSAEVRQWFENDDGGSFVMVNLIDLKPGGDELTAQYMDYMWPALLTRACHPVFGGEVLGPAMDVWGIEGAQQWTGAALMRYRSLRDLLEIAGNQEFSDSHEFKNLAMTKTIAVPVSTGLNPADLRILVGLLLLIVLLLLLRRR